MTRFAFFFPFGRPTQVRRHQTCGDCLIVDELRFRLITVSFMYLSNFIRLVKRSSRFERVQDDFAFAPYLVFLLFNDGVIYYEDLYV
jgi:hypothetical protein